MTTSELLFSLTIVFIIAFCMDHMNIKRKKTTMNEDKQPPTPETDWKNFVPLKASDLNGDAFSIRRNSFSDPKRISSIDKEGITYGNNGFVSWYDAMMNGWEIKWAYSNEWVQCRKLKV